MEFKDIVIMTLAPPKLEKIFLGGGSFSEIVLLMETYFTNQPWRARLDNHVTKVGFTTRIIEGAGAKCGPTKHCHISL